ncbi:MAG: GntR family transcriptional regulator [Chloroflexota bacterium]|nr:MAG: hypothetical protein DIU68_14320 [Chloroflexota bacterium]
MVNYAHLDRASVEPLYVQLRNLIIEAIRSGELQPGQQAPSINTLCALTGISRMTVRKAIDMLVQEEWLQTTPGKGTFVAAKPKIAQSMQHLMGWTDEMRARGLTPSTQLVSVGIVPASPTIAHHLSLSPHDPVVEITRVRFADDMPLVIEIARVSEQRFPGILEVMREAESLYRVLHERYGLTLTRAFQSIEAGLADTASARLLKITPGAPILVTERITYDDRDRPVEYVYAKHRADAVRFTGELNADPRSGLPAMREISGPVRLWAAEEGG